MSKLKNFGFKLIAVFTLVLIGVGNLAFAGKSNNTLTWTTDRDLDVALPYYNNTREVVVMSYMGWDTLLFRNPKTFEYEPLLATSYKWVDTVTLEFDLRNDVTFHNGKKFSADDVVYTFNHVASEESGVLTRRNVNWIKNAERLGDYKVRINLLKPFPAALEYLAGPTPIFPVGFWEKAPIAGSKKDFGAVNPVNSGTGPYKITKVVPGESVHFELNKNYFKGAKGKSSIGKIVFRIISDPEAQIAELITGGVDWIWDVSKDKAEQLESMGPITVVNAPTMRISYIQFNSSGKGGNKTPFMDYKVRKAVAHAINREAIAKHLVGGASAVIHSACYPSQFGCTQDVPQYSYDPGLAKKLLAEAGYPNGFETDIYAYRQREFTEAVIGDLKKIDIQANLKYMQYKALRGLVWESKTPFHQMTWGSYSVNDVSAITSHFFKNTRDDYAMDLQLKAWLETADTSTDPQVRIDNYKKALTRISGSLYWLPMFTYAKYYAFNKDLDFTPTPDEIPQFYAARWK